ncbi:hypothetical protein HN419_05265 [Candidatus Woesearchaeota archaeon]|mgnify:FL=1|jgi:DNA excision repair protein ERCC-4|nr:hypothetical protein [Candidatus Woesearchaeota archaeon]MBT3537719.1 hypothetical protein [Candidatus Woesearchaeota archaeon]MBT4697850.1 hypothetical protein [Candidatus Woesearchaeota archaeon]MBT4717490.1 hypothetical protein [Candidatus Woesearchaeota archaeon]MBT7105388.1 hypothetical protein [Candidatus Woesearchaeota archaeon]
MEIIIDTREQRDYSEEFDKLNIKYRREKLPTGDYLLWPKSCVVERKNLDDWICSITRDRDRFVKEIERGLLFDFFAIIIEADYYDIINGNYYANVPPNVILSTMLKWQVKYRIPIILTGTRQGGALAISKLFEGYLQYEDKNVR